MSDRTIDESVCDFCGLHDTEFFTYVTPTEYATEAEALEKQGFWTEDPEWAACSTCHRLIQDGKRDALYMRAMLHYKDFLFLGANEFGVFDKVDQAAFVRKVHDIFWERRTDEWWPGLGRRHPITDEGTADA